MSEARVAIAPFTIGERFVLRHRPEQGSLAVSDCRWAGSWRVWWGVPGDGGSAEATACVPLPRGWREPPTLPMTQVARLRAAYDRDIPRAALRGAELADQQPAARAANTYAYRALAAWWREVGARIDAPTAMQQAAGLTSLADDLERGR